VCSPNKARVKKRCEIKGDGQEMTGQWQKILITGEFVCLPQSFIITAISWPPPSFFIFSSWLIWGHTLFHSLAIFFV